MRNFSLFSRHRKKVPFVLRGTLLTVHFKVLHVFPPKQHWRPFVADLFSRSKKKEKRHGGRGMVRRSIGYTTQLAFLETIAANVNFKSWKKLNHCNPTLIEKGYCNTVFTRNNIFLLRKGNHDNWCAYSSDQTHPRSAKLQFLAYCRHQLSTYGMGLTWYLERVCWIFVSQADHEQ